MSFDLQSVLQIPRCSNSLLYYSRKLSVYNLTVWEGKAPNSAHCFCWTEIDGKRGSCEIGTCLYKWLFTLPDNIQEVSFFSDTCSGQNRNVYVLGLLIYMAHKIKKIKVITQNFLESGHTFMEVDSMHSTIEHEVNHRECYAMTEWENIFRNARKTKDPYNVMRLRYIDFLDLKEFTDKTVKNKNVDVTGNKVNWLLIKSIKVQADSPLHFFLQVQIL